MKVKKYTHDRVDFWEGCQKRRQELRQQYPSDLFIDIARAEVELNSPQEISRLVLIAITP